MRLLITAIRRRTATFSASTVEPARRVAVEWQGIVPAGAHLRRYLAATRGLSGAVGEEEVPPAYSAVWETALTLELLSREGMPFPSGGIVHLGSELVMVRPLHADELIRCRLEMDRIEAHPRGVLLRLSCRSWNEPGQLCLERATSLLLRGAELPRGSTRRASDRDGGGAEVPAEDDWWEVASWTLRAGAGRRYALASGDFNPIHLWRWSSRLLGFERPILHGHCTLAMTSHELERFSGRRTRRLEGWFRAPLELPAKVRLEAAGHATADCLQVRLVGEGREARPFLEGKWLAG